MFLIKVSGCTGSGKTTLANHWANVYKSTGKSVYILSTDSFYISKDDLPSNIHWDHPMSIEWNLLNKVLNKINNKEPFQVPVYDFKTHSRTHFETITDKFDIVILEGIFAMQPEIKKMNKSLNVYIETPIEICYSRRKERDLNTRESVNRLDEIWEKYVLYGF